MFVKTGERITKMWGDDVYDMVIEVGGVVSGNCECCVGWAEKIKIPRVALRGRTVSVCAVREDGADKFGFLIRVKDEPGLRSALRDSVDGEDGFMYLCRSSLTLANQCLLEMV